MEAVPRLPMLSFELKHSPEYIEFGPSLKQYIRDHYGEDPALYNKPCTDLEQLRQGAIHVTRDFMGCSTLKKYYAQLQFLQGRFPMGEGGEAAIAFTWEDIQTGREYILGDIKFEQACILYNIGALHSILGAMDTRNSAEGMKVSCTHFQCAAWAFEHLRDHFGSSAMSTDMSHELLTFHVSLMLAQGQECILEKSMIDSRKNTITAKVAAQVVEFYRTAIKNLETCNQEGIVSSRCYKDWKKRMELKTCFYQCITHYYMGRQAEEQQKMGERLAYFQAGQDKLNESVKLAKNEVPEIQDALKFAQDVVGGKFNSAKKDNDFVYHEKVPGIETLPEVKGASLVKGIPFNPTDPEISGHDIFQKLVPMEAHEASSVYSEEKAKLLRGVSGEVEEKAMELEQYMSSLQLDPNKLLPRMEPLPQELLEKCAAMSVKTEVIQNLIESMAAVAGRATEVELNLKETGALLEEEKKQEEEFQKKFGARAPNIVLSEIRKDMEIQRDKHKQGNQSNENLHKAMNVHIANLRLLAGAPDELQATLPEQELTNSPEDEAIVQELQRLLSKVDTMRKQRTTLMDELRTQIQNDDITNVLVTQDTGNKDSIYNEQLKKHDKQIQLIRQNLSAQENILRALTDTNARYATIRRATSESIARRNARISELIKSYEVYEDLMGKSQKGLDYYKKLEETVTRILQRCRSVCKVQQEERDQITKRFAPKEPAPSRPAAPKPVPGQSPSPIHGAAQIPGEASLPTFEGPKLKDYLPFMKPATFGPKADRAHPESPDVMQGGSLPASVTGSPVHHSPGRGSPRSSPARQLPAAGIDYSGLPPELTAQLAKLPAGFFNKLKDGAPAPSPVAPDLTDGLQHRHTPPVPDTGIDPNLPAEIQAQLAKLPKGFFSQLKSNPGQGLGDQPSSLPHIPSSGFNPGGSNLGQNEYGSMPNMSQLPQQARKYDSTSTVSSVETPVISPTKGPQGDRTGHFHSYHGGQTVNYQGQDLPKGQLHQQQLPNQYQNPNLYSSGQAGPAIPPQNAGYSIGPNQMPNQVTTQHAPMTSQASLSQLPQHQPIPPAQHQANPPAQHLAQQPNELQRPSPASTPQSSHYPASSQNPNLQSQYQYQQMPQTSLQSQYPSGNLPQQTQQPAHQQQQQQHQQQQYQQTYQQPQQYQQPLPQQPQQQQHSLQNQQQYQTQQVLQPSSQFYQTSGQGIAGQNMSTGTKSQATSVPPTGYTQHAPASQYGMTPQGQVAPQAYPNQHVQGAPRFQTPVHQPQTQPSQAQQPQVQQPQSNIGYSQQSTTQFSGNQQQRPHQANVQSWQNPTSQVPSSQNQASVAYTGQTQQFQNQQQNQFSQPGYVQPQSVQQPIAQSSQSYVQPSVSSSQTFYSQQTSTTYNQTFQNQAVSQSQAYNQQNKMTQQYQMPAQNQSMGSQGLPQSNYQVGHSGQTTVQSQNYQLHTGNQQQISQQQGGQQQVGQQHVSQQHLAQVGQQQVRQQQVGQQISQQQVGQQQVRQQQVGQQISQQVGQQQGRQQQVGQQQVGQQQPGLQQPHGTTGQYQYNQQQQGQAQVQSWQQVPQANQAAYTSQQQPRHSQPTQGYSQQATPNLGYSQQGQTAQNFNQQMRPTGPSQAQQMQYQPVLQPTQASQPLPTQMTPSSQQTPLSPIVSSQPPLPQPTHPVQPTQVAPQGPSHGVPQTVSSLHPASQRSVPGSNLSRQSSSLDEILSSSPEGTKDSTIPAPMIAPKVLTAQEIQHQKEEALKNKGIFDPPKEPYAPGCELNKFVSDVEDFGKLVDELTVANVMGQTKLDALWKDLQENQEHESKRHSIAIARCYPMKNRDPDIMPYDETRVMLSTMKDDYINASWINDLAPSCPKFITTQSPIPVTVNDFWVMVYEQGVEVIVMITSEYETGKKFPCYWPTEKGKQIEHGPVILNLQSVKYKEFWTERIIHLKHSETKVGRTVVHLQYKNWPVSGFPDNVSHVVKFITEVHNFYRQQRSLMKPVLVHCGNGIGRSGSFLLTYTGMQEILQGNGLVQVPVMARRLLHKRKNILQNKEQIKFSYDSILFFAEDFLKKKDVLVKKPHYMERKKSSDSHSHLPAKDDIVLGTVNLEIIKQNVGKFGEKHGDSHNTSSNGDMQQGQTTLDTMTIPREDNSLSTLPDLIQQPSRTENLGQVSGLNPSQNAPASHSDVSSGLGSPQVRSRSGSNSSILSGSSISGTSLKGSPQHKADGQSMPSSLADLQNPNTFTLGTAAPEKKKISKSNFSSKSTGIKENLNKPDDPLSSLDPLWTIAKEK